MSPTPHRALHGRPGGHPAQPRHAPLRHLLHHNGKPFKVTITAVMRKLIVTLNAILRSGQPWAHAKLA
jgi:transposase